MSSCSQQQQQPQCRSRTNSEETSDNDNDNAVSSMETTTTTHVITPITPQATMVPPPNVIPECVAVLASSTKKPGAEMVVPALELQLEHHDKVSDAATTTRNEEAAAHETSWKDKDKEESTTISHETTAQREADNATDMSNGNDSKQAPTETDAEKAAKLLLTPNKKRRGRYDGVPLHARQAKHVVDKKVSQLVSPSVRQSVVS
jgi:hypothetical protein